MERALNLVYVVIPDLSQHQMDIKVPTSVFGVVEQIMSPKNVPEEEAEHVIPANLPAT